MQILAPTKTKAVVIKPKTPPKDTSKFPKVVPVKGYNVRVIQVKAAPVYSHPSLCPRPLFAADKSEIEDKSPQAEHSQDHMKTEIQIKEKSDKNTSHIPDVEGEKSDKNCIRSNDTEISDLGNDDDHEQNENESSIVKVTTPFYSNLF